MQLPGRVTAIAYGEGVAPSEHALACCGLAKQLEKAGEYDQAREVLTEFWPERDGLSRLDGLEQMTQAEVLLRVGALSGWLGSAQQTDGSQELAKNYITRAIDLFNQLGKSERTAEARGDLALCYWREGSFDEARIQLRDALRYVESDTDLKAVLLVRSGLVEVTAGRLSEALRFYDESSPLVDSSTDDALKGSFHNGLGTLLNCMGLAEKREDYTDRSLVEFAAASFHFERAGHTRYQACVDINLGFLFFTLARFSEAHRYLDRARSLFLNIDDQVHLAQVDDTRARTLLAEGQLHEAERFARQSVRTLEKDGEQALLAEALTTYGIVQARLANYSRAKALLQRAIEVAEIARDPEGAGRAQLSIIEELAEQTSAIEMTAIYQAASELLQRSQDPSATRRLISCARRVIDSLGALRPEEEETHEPSWEGFSFKQEILKCEKSLIERALRDTGGSVTRAARLLGFRHHQSLISLINSRHTELLKTRTAVRKRRRHLFSASRMGGTR